MPEPAAVRGGGPRRPAPRSAAAAARTQAPPQSPQVRRVKYGSRITSPGRDGSRGRRETRVGLRDRTLSPAELETLWKYPSAPQYRRSPSPHFSTLKLYDDALAHRYGNPRSLTDYVARAQLAQYENVRAQYEAYARNATDATAPSTGVVYWMFNSGWTSLHWQLVDRYLDLGGAYYGAKKANEPLHIQYSYDDRTVAVINRRPAAAPGLTARVTGSASGPASTPPSPPPTAPPTSTARSPACGSQAGTPPVRSFREGATERERPADAELMGRVADMYGGELQPGYAAPPQATSRLHRNGRPASGGSASRLHSGVPGPSDETIISLWIRPFHDLVAAGVAGSSGPHAPLPAGREGL